MDAIQRGYREMRRCHRRERAEKMSAGMGFGVRQAIWPVAAEPALIGGPRVGHGQLFDRVIVDNRSVDERRRQNSRILRQYFGINRAEYAGRRNNL